MLITRGNLHLLSYSEMHSNRLMQHTINTVEELYTMNQVLDLNVLYLINITQSTQIVLHAFGMYYPAHVSMNHGDDDFLLCSVV